MNWWSQLCSEVARPRQQLFIGTSTFQISHALSRDDKQRDGDEERPLM
jgi:hypothetical protein